VKELNVGLPIFNIFFELTYFLSALLVSTKVILLGGKAQGLVYPKRLFQKKT
jgi:hypothetical protein